MKFENTFKHWHDHLFDSIRPPWRFSMSSFAVFATLWTLIEASSFFEQSGAGSIQNGSFYLYLILFSMACGFSHSFIKSRRSTPSFAEDLPKEAQRIVREQKKGWEFHMAQVLLVSRIQPLDQRLEGILNGTRFVVLQPTLNPVEYVAIIGLRSDNLIRMAYVAKHIFEESFPRCFSGRSPAEERVSRIITAVREVEVFYETTIAMEEELHSMGVPDGFERLHEMQANWTEAIRVPLRELLRFLQEVRVAVKLKEENPLVDFSLELEPPQNIEVFNQEIARLSALYRREY